MKRASHIADSPIDIVYLWCDGSDPVFLKRKQQYVPQNAAEELAGKCRNFDSDELKYSLRSLEKYAPWLNHIYIVTDNQVPSWLNTDNPKVSVIDLTEILPTEVLPLFNSEAIETSLHKIPGLSEFFLYACDDMFLGSDVEPDFFFTNEGFPIIRGSRKFLQDYPAVASSYMRNVLRSAFVVWKKTGNTLLFTPHHNIDAYRKSFLEDAALLFSEECSKTLSQRFRGKNAPLRYVAHCLDYAKGRGVFKQVESSQLLWTNRLRNAFSWFVKASDSFYSSLHTFKKSHQKMIQAGKYKLFCLNDDPETLDDEREGLKRFLESLFPVPSAFEKS